MPGRRARRVTTRTRNLVLATSWHDVAIRLAFVADFVACSRVLSRASRALRDWTGQVSCSCVARVAHDVCVRVHCRGIVDGAECCLVQAHGSMLCIVEAGPSCGRRARKSLRGTAVVALARHVGITGLGKLIRARRPRWAGSRWLAMGGRPAEGRPGDRWARAGSRRPLVVALGRRGTRRWHRTRDTHACVG